MKVDLTQRDIELLLLVLNDVAQSYDNLDEQPIYSIEEFTLVEKLEAALRKSESAEKMLLDTKVERVYH